MLNTDNMYALSEVFRFCLKEKKRVRKKSRVEFDCGYAAAMEEVIQYIEDNFLTKMG